MKIVVFDLDETLGYFVQFGIFWECLNRFFSQDKAKDKETKEDTNKIKLDFNEILDLYPEFLRPGIMNILDFLKNKKKTNCCHKLMIYTNNQGPETWAKNIIGYFEKKLNFKLVDQIIKAFKINGKRVEICRTSHDKSYNDLIRCTKLPKHAEICFIDDVYHPGMHNGNIFYINIKPYVHDLKIDDMLNTFVNSKIGQKYLNNAHENIVKQFVYNMKKQYNMYNFKYIYKTPKDYDVDKIITKQIFIYLMDFFNKKPKA